jgi:hypothetical protein
VPWFRQTNGGRGITDCIPRSPSANRCTQGRPLYLGSPEPRRTSPDSLQHLVLATLTPSSAATFRSKGRLNPVPFGTDTLLRVAESNKTQSDDQHREPPIVVCRSVIDFKFHGRCVELGERRGQAPATGSAPPIQVEVCCYPQTSTRGG